MQSLQCVALDIFLFTSVIVAESCGMFEQQLILRPTVITGER